MQKTGVMGGYFKAHLPADGSFTWRLIPFILIWTLFVLVIVTWLFIQLCVPYPRPPKPSEKKYRAVDRQGKISDPEPLPCWHDAVMRKYEKLQKDNNDEPQEVQWEKEIDPAEVFMTVVVPAFNEEHRLTGMLEEAVNFLETTYGSAAPIPPKQKDSNKNYEPDAKDDTPTLRQRPMANANSNGTTITSQIQTPSTTRGWEILIIDDGSTDGTVTTAETFSRVHIVPKRPRRVSGPWTQHSEKGVSIPPGSIRIVSLEQNRGKGGAVTHGMRHARGSYVVFADADGASKFDDLGKLVTACKETEDPRGCAVAVGSRAHLVDSEAVVKRSKLRNFLMHSFHLLLKFMTPRKTAMIKDTQCGFKLFSRSSLPYIIPHMHMEGWIFDVEMLMLAEFAGIPVVEVPVGWREVMGSKLNVITDSIGMAWGLAILRFCWAVGIYRR